MPADLSNSAAISRPIPRPISHNAFDNAVSPMGTSDSQLINLQNGLLTRDEVHSGTTPRLVRVQSVGSPISQSFTPGLGSSPARSFTLILNCSGDLAVPASSLLGRECVILTKRL